MIAQSTSLNTEQEQTFPQSFLHTLEHTRSQSLKTIEEQVKACTRCPLAQMRTQVVFGGENPCARVVIVGEAPGRNEDKSGVPFVGAAGKQLNEYLSLAKLQRSDVYIANVVKCRPPSNRNPYVGEIQACADYLRQQIRIIWPEVIVCLGNFATRFILHTEKGISELRGSMQKTGSFYVLPTYHPAAAIYNRSLKSDIERDFMFLGSWLQSHTR